MKRVIQKNKPKQVIVENLIKSFYMENPTVDKAVISIKADKMSRSVKQNSLYWQWVSVYASETGYTKEAMHDIMRHQHLGYRTTKTKDGKVIEVLRSTTKLNVDEMREYMEQIDMQAAEFGIALPRPDDLYMDAMFGKSETG